MIMCETKVMTKKIPKTRVEQIENNGKLYSYLYPSGDLIQGSFH
jgi:hypothetical protein